MDPSDLILDNEALITSASCWPVHDSAQLPCDTVRRVVFSAAETHLLV